MKEWKSSLPMPLGISPYSHMKMTSFGVNMTILILTDTLVRNASSRVWKIEILRRACSRKDRIHEVACLTSYQVQCCTEEQSKGCTEEQSKGCTK